MSRLQYRGLIGRAAVVVVLLSARPTDAQDVAPCLAGEPCGLLNAYIPGVRIWPEVVGQAKAERCLQYLEAKQRRDAERGDLAAVDRDLCQIDRLKYRISINEWLIRKNLNQAPCFSPHPIPVDCMTRAAIAEFVGPPQAPYPLWPFPTPGPMGAVPTIPIPITIVNAEPAGAGVAFAIDGVAHQAAGGSRQDLVVAPDSNITYDGGGSIGQRRYRISPGLYEFRSTAEGWALYKLRGMP